MSRAALPPALARALRQWRRRDALPRLVAFAAAMAVPWLLWHAGASPWLAMAVAAAIVVAAMLWWTRHARRHDAQWLLRRLDAGMQRIEDSSDLLVADPAHLGTLERLQQARIAERLAASDPAGMLPAPRWRPAFLACGVAALLVAAALLRPAIPPAPAPTLSPVPSAAPEEAQQVSADLRITPPPYTGLPARRQAELDLVAEQGASLRWSLSFALPPTAVRLQFVDGAELVLQHEEGRWTGQREAEASTLYRIALEGAPPVARDTAYRLEVLPDRAPELVVEQPAQTLTLLEQGARSWELVVTASDDHGLGPARLQLTLAQGEGEQVAVSERSIALQAEGDDPRLRRYVHRVDLTALGFSAGSDLIARVDVRDLRTPQPNHTRSPALILRWPGERAGQGSGIEGLVQDAMPAYFRSQRQIIIDTEALLAEWDGLAPDTRTGRSDALGVDQRILRLRYGQFLGEEAEDIAAPPGLEDDHDDDHEDDESDAHAGHEHESAAPPPTRFGEESGEIAAAGHLHDLPEAATLLDPETRRILRAALAEMWQAELHLRLGEPAQALPYENRALEFIKQVQQANRIYLARVGLDVTPLDPSRRLTGERDPLPPRPDPLVPREQDDPLRDWWPALEGEGTLPWDAVARWARTQELADPLAVLADIEQLQRGPCAPCRQRLRDAFWPLLPTATAAPAPRSAADAVGAAWLRALDPPAAEPQP